MAKKLPQPTTEGGGKGGHTRSVLRIMQRAVERGEAVGDGGLAEAIIFAKSVIANKKASGRDRLRASEFLASVTAKGIDVAMYLDKNNRIDDGKDTERVSHAVVVKGVDLEAL